MQKVTLFLILALHSILTLSQHLSGLRFSAHDSIKEKRTSMVLSPDFNASKGFTLDFDIKFRFEEHNFGYIFRIVIDDGKSFDLISNMTSGRKSLSLIEGNDVYMAFDERQLQTYVIDKWTHVRCTIYPDNLFFTFGNLKCRKQYPKMDIKNVKFYFGLSDHEKFYSSDVPPMTIRNVKITDGRERTVVYWPLKEHLLNSALDTLHHIPASVTNPIWEIDKHTKWIKEKTLKLSRYTQICHAPSRESIYFVNSSSVLAYSMANNVVDTLLPKHGVPYTEINNQLIYHPYYDELWSYDFDALHPLSVYSFKDNAWTNKDRDVKNPEYSQHNAFISPVDSCLYVFGGYGNYMYKNQILKSGKAIEHWQTVPYGKKIPPRYLSGLGWMGRDTVLIFGGCGNPKGKQELGIENYYDLYAIDVKTFQTKKLWTAGGGNKNFVVGNNVVVDKVNNKLYALCFPNEFSNSYVLLKSFNLKNGKECTDYADSIPFYFNDVSSFCTLYYDSFQSRLYAVTSSCRDNQTDIVNIYSLAYPPLQVEDTLQTNPEESHSVFLYLIIGGVCIGVVALLVSLKKTKLDEKTVPDVSPVAEDSMPICETDVPQEEKEGMPVPVVHQKSSILFLNGFQVWDKEGKDITKLFTPILKQLLVLAILYTVGDKKGVSNTTLRELLWFDKEEDSAQNNRRVNIRKLKLLLEKLDGVELIREGTYWKVRFAGTYCDYVEAWDFIERVQGNEAIENIRNLPLNLLSGQLLPYIQTDWLDSFKANYDNAVLDVATSLSKREDVQKDNKMLIALADSMFAHDKMDEYALELKCQALYRSGRTSLAKTVFDTFCYEYKTMLEVDYGKTFNQIINNAL